MHSIRCYSCDSGQKRSGGVALQDHNTAEEVFREFIREHDEIFLVLCGHHHGQSRRVDSNRFGHDVHQVLADYQVGDRSGTLELEPQMLVLLPEESRFYLVYRKVFNFQDKPKIERSMRLRLQEGWYAPPEQAQPGAPPR